jgi:hypothetical protein
VAPQGPKLGQSGASRRRAPTQIPFYTNVCAVTADSSSRALICGTVPVAFPARSHRPASVMIHPARRRFDENGRRLHGGGAGEPFPVADWVAVPRALRARRANSSPHSPHSTCPGCLQPAAVGSTGPCQYAPLSQFQHSVKSVVASGKGLRIAWTQLPNLRHVMQRKMGATQTHYKPSGV